MHQEGYPSPEEVFSSLAEQTMVHLPPQHRRPLAVVGAGAVVSSAHLPAYRQLGLEVCGIYDHDRPRAQQVAERHGIPRAYGTLEELMSDPAVEVVDVAVPPWEQPEIALEAIRCGHHVLCQKPFVLDHGLGRSIVAAAQAAGVCVAVNQQMRWLEAIAVSREVVRSGWIGEVVHMSFDVDLRTDFSRWPWLLASPRLDLLYHSIHYLDSVRSILGNPHRVFAAASRMPAQAPLGETRTISTLLFGAPLRAVLQVNHENLAGDQRAGFRIDGSKGSIRGSHELFDGDARNRGRLEICSQKLGGGGWLEYPLTRQWIPDAFAGPIAGLLSWVATGVPSDTSARDNLDTIALVAALYRSIDSGDAQEVAYL